MSKFNELRKILEGQPDLEILGTEEDNNFSGQGTHNNYGDFFPDYNENKIDIAPKKCPLTIERLNDFMDDISKRVPEASIVEKFDLRKITAWNGTFYTLDFGCFRFPEKEGYTYVVIYPNSSYYTLRSRRHPHPKSYAIVLKYNNYTKKRKIPKICPKIRAIVSAM